MLPRTENPEEDEESVVTDCWCVPAVGEGKIVREAKQGEKGENQRLCVTSRSRQSVLGQ